MNGYPVSRYPSLRRPSAEDVRLKLERLVSARPDSGLWIWEDYRIVRGDKILLVALSEYEPLVVETLCQVLRAKGAKVDVITIDSEPIASPQDLASHEAISLGKEEGDFSYYYSMICDNIRPDTVRALIAQERYTKIIGGAAGPKVPVPIPWLRFCFWSLEDFAEGGVADFPPDLFLAIAKIAWSQIQSCETLRLSDPEGTDVKYTNYKDERPFFPGHLHAKPTNIGQGFGGRDDCEGIIAGTTSHMAAYPHIKAYIEQGQVVKVEGGGTYGDAWREKLEIYGEVRLPPIKARQAATDTVWTMGTGALAPMRQYTIDTPGFFWFFECAVGCEPKVSRLPKEGLFQCYANHLHERRRTGFVHCGFGPPYGLTQSGVPWAHVHVHCMFATLEGVTSRGKPVRIIDKGHLCALDDPKVREQAAKHGDPDQLLQEAWMPAIPGINSPGDYMKDYGRDPISWIMKEAREHPVWVD